MTRPDAMPFITYLSQPKGRMRMFVDEPPPRGWLFDHCEAETDNEETDGCRGCEGWGIECAAYWSPLIAEVVS